MTQLRDRAERALDRAQRRRDRSKSPFTQIPFAEIRNPMPPVELVGEAGVEQIHAASMRVLEEVGIEFLDDEALDLWSAAGADVDRSTQRVRMDQGLVLDLVSKAPQRFTWHARNPAHTVTVGDNRLLFAPNGGTVFASDLDRGRRPGTLEDFHNMQRIVQMAGVLHIAGEQLVVPHDVQVAHRHLERLWAGFTLTDKCMMEAAHGRIIPADAIAAAEIIFGAPLPADGVVIGGIINANSPLRYDDRMLGGLITFARAGQLNIITPFILAGVMSPVTMAAAVAQQNAEALAGIALTQLVRPGVPVIYGGFTTNVDLKSGAPAFGTPEGAWALLLGAQMARRYKLPYRGSGTLTTAKVPDAEAATQTQWSIWPCVLAHTNFVMHSVGWLESGLTASFEKMVMDIEHLAMFQHFLQGPQINTDTLAVDAIAQVGTGGHHLGTDHTKARYTTAFYTPFLADRLPYETWDEAGRFDSPMRANLLWKQLLQEYEAPPLDEAKRDALNDFVQRRKHTLRGANLYT
jgi:trimethylamine---corrinoid protein Co-methyltransferase